MVAGGGPAIRHGGLDRSGTSGGDMQQDAETADPGGGRPEAQRAAVDTTPLVAAALQCHQSGQLTEAEQFYRQVLAADPHNADSLHLLGLLAYQTGRVDVALGLLHQAIAAAPDTALFHTNLGVVQQAAGRVDDAIASYRCAAALGPDLADAHKNLGTALLEQGALDAAEACFRTALALRPDYPEACHNLASLLVRQKRMLEAADCYRLLTAGDPNNAEAHLNLAEVLLALQQPLAAIPSYRSALALRPDWSEALIRLGTAHNLLAQHEDAIRCFQAATRLRPTDAEAHTSLAIALLSAGDLAAAWPEYEWRWQLKPPVDARRSFAGPLWRGEPAAGKTLLVHAEQGFGDTLQFCRYVPLLHQRGLRVILEAPAPLLRLLRSLPGVAHLATTGDALPGFDLRCPMLSLPLAFGTTLANIPSATRYLEADASEVAAWSARLAADAPGGLRVGLVWAGNPEHECDPRRSLAPGRLAPLAAVPNVRFICLQETGFPRADDFPLIDYMEEISDFAATAALVANLDLVVTVDTAIVHLAGALGKPVWLLTRFDACWRWLTGRRDSPWYPALRIFRQPSPGDWDSVIAEVARALRLQHDEDVR
jgi:tetratricopeptide (TPR) repeat protein